MTTNEDNPFEDVAPDGIVTEPKYDRDALQAAFPLVTDMNFKCGKDTGLKFVEVVTGDETRLIELGTILPQTTPELIAVITEGLRVALDASAIAEGEELFGDD